MDWNFVKAKLRTGAAIIVLAVIGAAGVLLHGDHDYNIQSIVLVCFRLNLLLLWAWFSGWMLDLSNGVKYEADRKLIEDGNLAVANSRAYGFAALVIAGALLIARV